MYISPQNLQRMTKDVGLTLDHSLHVVLSKAIRIGDTKYHI